MGQEITFKFTKLTPTKDADIKGYEDALEYALDNSQNSDIRNIALAGPYGSGKSSVISTFANRYGKNFINVSLAHFTDGTDDDKEFKTEIEKKIVNSLVQQIPKKQVPDSKFHIKEDTKSFAIKVTAIFLGIAAFALYLSKIAEIKKLLEHLCGNNTAHLIMPLAGIVFFIWAAISFSVLIYKVARWQGQDRLIAKIKHNGDELEFKENGPSYFDRHLDEILYLLVNADCDGFVFEDLDRFSNSKIKLFEHLRELCELANQRRQRQGLKGKINNGIKKPIRFFYLVSDTIFMTEERTKFFDFIIPIIPVVDTSNSCDRLQEYLTETELINKVDYKFLRGISFYLEDMRIVRNVVNEYQIYAHKNKDIKRDATQLLALVVYKNVFPEDFANLQVDKGYVYSIFNKKNTLKTNKSKDIQADIDKLVRAKKEPLESLQELEAIRNDRERYPAKYIYYKKYDDWIKDDYPLRKEAIEKKLSNNIIDKDLEKKYRDLIHVSSKKLAQLIDDTNRDFLYEVEIENIALKSMPQYHLIRYLIEGGYLDEDTYRDFISVFCEGAISISDLNFIRAVNNSDPVEAEQKLDDVAKIVESLDSGDFLKKSTKNYSLINYIFKMDKKDCIDSFIMQLKENNDLKFVEDFYNHSENSGIFVKSIIERWDDALARFIDSIYSQESTEMAAQVVQRIVLSAIVNSTDELIKKQNEDNILTQYLSEDAELLTCDAGDVDRIISFFKSLGVSFEDIENQICVGELFDAVYRENLYVLNAENISTILAKKYGKRIGDRYNTLLTLIYSDEAQPLYDYVQMNLEDVVNIEINNSDQIEDDESTAISVLNSEISADMLKKYIYALKDRIYDINDINDKTLWKDLLAASIVQETSENIASFFQQFGLTDALIKFINDSVKEIDFYYLIHDETIRIAFWEKSYCSNAYTTEAYEEICNNIGIVIENFNITDLGSEKIKCLISYELIRVNINNLNTIRVNYKEFVIDYICTDIDRYIALTQRNTIKMEEILGILDRPIPNEKKIALLKKAPQVKISLYANAYEDELTEYILENHLDSTELAYIFEHYEEFSIKGRDVIYTYAKASPNVLAYCDELPKTLLERLFADENFLLDDKITIFDSILDDIDKKTAAQLLILAGEINIAKIFQEGKRLSRIPNDSVHSKLLEVLTSHNYIDGYETNDTGLKIQKINKDKVKSR